MVIRHYKRGRLHGRFMEVDGEGRLISKGKYKTDKLHGKFVEYGNEKLDTTFYSHGLKLATEEILKSKDPVNEDTGIMRNESRDTERITQPERTRRWRKENQENR